MASDDPSTDPSIESRRSSDVVPTIDISAPSQASLADIDRACRDHGFFLLTGHGLDDVIADTWAQARAFFDTDRSNRTAIMRDADNALGYFDRELTKRRRDHKQVFDFTDPSTERGQARNRWPVDPPGFQKTLSTFYAAFSELALRTTTVVHNSLGLTDEQAGRYCGDPTTSAVRLNHYPVGDPVPADERDGLIELGETALGYHTDPGVLTLLLQDDTGGLQARSAAGEWVDIEPRPGTIVVNLADAMQVWTNDRYRAAEHRVLTMTNQDRISIPYFLNPVRGAVIEPVAELADLTGEAPVYRPFEWAEFMRARTDDNFTDLGAEDTQISNYRSAGV